MATLTDILTLFSSQGHAQYGGESVTQLEHGLQCATLAQTQCADPALVTACLLHDLGHLVHDLGENAVDRGIDDRHEYRALGWLCSLFGPEVTEPIRLHVEAKRYLCVAQPHYWHQLSPNSQVSLSLQGGPFSPPEATQFLAHPYAQDAIQLRLWDEQAKVPHLSTPSLNDFMPFLAASLR